MKNKNIMTNKNTNKTIPTLKIHNTNQNTNQKNHLPHNNNNFQAFCQESIVHQITYHGYQKIAKNAAHTQITMNATAQNITDLTTQNALPVVQDTTCHQNANQAEANHQLNPKITMFI